MRKPLDFFKNVDRTLVILFLIMIFLGWVNVYAAEAKEASQSILDLNQNYGKQLLWIIGSLFIAIVVLMIDAKFFPAFAWIMYGSMLVILVGILFFGTEINASRSWFRIGSFAIQPAEFAKYTAALALAKYMGGSLVRTPTFVSSLRALTIIAAPVLLIFLQNDTGTALVFFAMGLALFREGYVSSILLTIAITAIFLFVLTLLINEFLIIGGLAGISLIAAWLVRRRKSELRQLLLIFVALSAYVYSVDYVFENMLQPHQKLRIEVLIDESIDLQGAGYNLHQSKIAIGSGGFWGKGYLQGTQTKFNFVPEQSTDFIFCTIGEEWGFVGSITVVLLFLWMILRLVSLSERQRSSFSRIYGYCIASLLFFHFAINIGMTIGLVPVIGIPLPFFSYGGSSLWAFTIMLFTFIKLDAKRIEML
jgi:rod shape determining protein RodA